MATRREPSGKMRRHASDLRITVLDRPGIDLLAGPVQYKQKLGFKPKGLWYSCGDEWRELIRGGGYNKKLGAYVYGLELYFPSMRVIKTADDFDVFEKTFGVIHDDMGDLDTWIDWPRVARTCAGIEICPYQTSYPRSSLWYEGWDVASGCVWDRRAVLGYAEYEEVT